MSYESTAEPIKVGYLMDFKLPEFYPQEMKEDLSNPFELIFGEAMEQGLIDRPIQIVYREVEGLPKGTVKAVIDAYGELVDEGCLAVFGPHITDNCVPTREAIEERFQVPALSVTGSDDWLGEWTFSFPQGSLTDEPIFWADLLAKGGHSRGRRPHRAVAGRRDLPQELPKCLPAQEHSHRGGGVARPDRPGRHRSGAHHARSQARCAGALRLRLRDRVPQHRVGVAELGSAAVHQHSVPERVDQPGHVERVHGMDGGRPVRRGQSRRPAVPRQVRGEVRSSPAVLRAGGELRRRHRAAARRAATRIR